MAIVVSGRYAAGIAAVALLAGCGGSQGQAGGSSIVPQGAAAQSRAHKASSSSGDLVYVITSKAIVIASYPAWSIVTTVPGSWGNSFVCSDPNSGNVFVTTGYPSSGEVLEYAHGGTSPIATLNAPTGSYVLGCAVDPTTGNLAAAGGGGALTHGGVLVWAQAEGTPTAYSDNRLRNYSYPAYDDAGNLYVTAATVGGKFRIAEQKAGHKRFTLSTIASLSFVNKIQWDGTYLATEVWNGQGLGSTAYQIQISGHTGTIANTIQLARGGGTYFWIQDGQLIGWYGKVKRRNNHAVAAWSYPSGGKSTSGLYGLTMGKKDGIGDLTVSVPPPPRQ